MFDHNIEDKRMESPTKYWHKLTDNRIQCDLCPRMCKLNEGQKGLCFVRERKNDEIVLTTYGLSSGYCIDPIEKKPLNHFLPGTAVLSFGTAGCNLTCKHCQNWDISKSREIHSLCDRAMPETIAKAAKDLSCQSIAFTYNEPIIFMEYATDTAKACHDLSIKTIAVTAGYISEAPRKEFFQYMDAANVDLKAFSEDFYQKLASAHLKPVLDTLYYLRHHTKVWLEITTLLIPGENDSEQELEALTKWVVENLGVDVPIHFTAFHPTWKMRNIPSTPPETLVRAQQIAIKNGIRYAYTGNVHDQKGGSTYCHHCGKCIISRDWYRILDYKLNDNGQCTFCGAPCSGVFANNAGTWGAKRQPVYLRDYE